MCNERCAKSSEDALTSATDEVLNMSTGSVTTRRRAAGLCVVFTFALGITGVRPAQSPDPGGEVDDTGPVHMPPRRRQERARLCVLHAVGQGAWAPGACGCGRNGTYPAVAANGSEHLARQGYVVPISSPRRVTATDLADADIVISLGCDVSKLPGASARHVASVGRSSGTGGAPDGSGRRHSRACRRAHRELVGRAQ